MRKLLLATAALVGLGLAPAFADDSITRLFRRVAMECHTGRFRRQQQPSLHQPDR